MSSFEPFRVSFVCSGNICRSPMGEVIFRDLAAQAGLGDRFAVTSRGTNDYHVGEPADPRTIAALALAGYDGSSHRAAQVSPADISNNELLIAMDRGHERALRSLGAEQIALLTEFDPARPSDPDVFDPYYSGDDAFTAVREQVERSCAILLDELRDRLAN